MMLLRAGERSCQSTPLNLRSSNDDRWHQIASCARRPRTLREDAQCLVVSSPEKQRPQHLESSKGASGQLKVRHTRCANPFVHTRTRLAHACTTRIRAQMKYQPIMQSLLVRPPPHPHLSVKVSYPPLCMQDALFRAQLDRIYVRPDETREQADVTANVDMYSGMPPAQPEPPEPPLPPPPMQPATISTASGKRKVAPCFAAAASSTACAPCDSDSDSDGGAAGLRPMAFEPPIRSDGLRSSFRNRIDVGARY